MAAEIPLTRWLSQGRIRELESVFREKFPWISVGLGARVGGGNNFILAVRVSTAWEKTKLLQDHEFSQFSDHADIEVTGPITVLSFLVKNSVAIPPAVSSDTADKLRKTKILGRIYAEDEAPLFEISGAQRIKKELEAFWATVELIEANGHGQFGKISKSDTTREKESSWVPFWKTPIGSLISGLTPDFLEVLASISTEPEFVEIMSQIPEWRKIRLFELLEEFSDELWPDTLIALDVVIRLEQKKITVGQIKTIFGKMATNNPAIFNPSRHGDSMSILYILEIVMLWMEHIGEVLGEKEVSAIKQDMEKADIQKIVEEIRKVLD